MAEIQYPSNSHKSKQEQKQGGERKKMEKVTTGAVKTKNNELRKFRDVFIAEDAKTVKDHLVMDVLVPNVKKIIVDLIQDGISLLVYGTTSSRKNNTPAGRVSYGSLYKAQADRRPQEGLRTSYSYADVTLESRADAEDVLDRLREAINEYGSASVADLYDLIGVTGEFTDNKYGWVNLANASVERVRDGYLLKLPKALPLN